MDYFKDLATTSNKPEDISEIRLSALLSLEPLWSALGDCLSGLESGTDRHAALVLQPAVEAFFLVHAGEKDPEPLAPSQQAGVAAPAAAVSSRERQPSSLDLAPASPANLALDHSMNASQQPSDVYAHLPQDTQKFLRFAGISSF